MKSGKNENTNRRSSCPIACTLDLIGDKWSLVIIRDMQMFGKTKYEEFLASPEKISTNILADRLKKLEEIDLIFKTPYGSHSRRMSYETHRKRQKFDKSFKGTGWLGNGKYRRHQCFGCQKN